MDNDRNAPSTKGDVQELRKELKEDIAELRTELKGDIAELRTELKGDIAELRTELKQEAAQLRSEMQLLHDDLVERMRDSETKLLQAFYSYAEAN